MKFTLDEVKEFIEETETLDIDIGDDYLDGLHNTATAIIGHTTPYYLLFFILAMEFEPQLVVELGSWRAYAAAHFASGNPNGKVVTIDIHKDATQKEDHEITKQVAGHYGNLDFIHGWTWNVVPQVSAYRLPIDIMFVDAWHEYKYVKREWELYEPLLADEALVIFDDIMDAGGATVDMLKFWGELDYDKFVVETMHGGIPMGFVKYVR